MAGIHLAEPFPLYPNGFPPDVMREFERRTGRGSLGNKAASGTGLVLTSRRLFEDAPPWNPDPAKAELVLWCVAAAKHRGRSLPPVPRP